MEVSFGNFRKTKGSNTQRLSSSESACGNLALSNLIETEFSIYSNVGRLELNTFRFVIDLCQWNENKTNKKTEKSTSETLFQM